MRQFHLNLSSESSLLDEKYIATIRERSGMQFETVMDCVRLPYWNQQNQKPQDENVAGKQRGEVGGDRTKVSDPYTAIFR